MPTTEPEELLKECEDRLSKEYDVYPLAGCTGTAPTGEPYITYTCQGPKEEGAMGSNYGTTAMEAVENYRNQIASMFFFGRFPKCCIYWRHRPEIVKDPESERYDIWSRFLISNKRYFLPSEEYIAKKKAVKKSETHNA